jgi:hypothetical protein
MEIADNLSFFLAKTGIRRRKDDGKIKNLNRQCPVPELIHPVFAKISPKRSFSVSKNERFGLVFAKTETINSGTSLSSLITNNIHFTDSPYFSLYVHYLQEDIFCLVWRWCLPSLSPPPSSRTLLPTSNSEFTYK